MKRYFIIAMFLPVFTACEKQLDQKSNKEQFRLEHIADVQSMLDYYPYTGHDTGADEASADNYFAPDDVFNAYPDESKFIYTWGEAYLFSNDDRGAWGSGYSKIYYSNIALEALEKITKNAANAAEWNDVYGQALFKRGQALWREANVFTLPYDAATAGADMGLPIRLNSDFEERSVRSSLGATYERIIMDLKAAIPLMKVTPPHPIRPSRPAAYGMLSVVYLSMREYDKAKLYADSALMLHGQLLDYNTVNASPSVRYSFTTDNVESIYMSLADEGPLFITTARIDTILYRSYDNDDLRKLLYFRSRPDGYFSFKGSYAGSEGTYSGIATDELYLVRAECNARAGHTADAMTELNLLLENRYVTGTFVPLTAASSQEALTKILTERRKELVYRFSRWMDIRRFNKEGAGIVLKRIVNGQQIELLPNSPKYARPIPEAVIAISGMPQNPQN